MNQQRGGKKFLSGPPKVSAICTRETPAGDEAVPASFRKFLINIESFFGMVNLSFVASCGDGMTFQLTTGGAGSACPSPLIARTEKLCAPSWSRLKASGDRHAKNGPSSTLHS